MSKVLPLKDVVTRWNWTLAMIDRVLKRKKVRFPLCIALITYLLSCCRRCWSSWTRTAGMAVRRWTPSRSTASRRSARSSPSSETPPFSSRSPDVQSTRLAHFPRHLRQLADSPRRFSRRTSTSWMRSKPPSPLCRSIEDRSSILQFRRSQITSTRPSATILSRRLLVSPASQLGSHPLY